MQKEVELDGVEGWRKWKVTRTGYLKSATGWGGSKDWYSIWAEADKIPHPLQSIRIQGYHGFHAFKTEEVFKCCFYVSRPDYADEVYGTVAMYGPSVEHSNGYRAATCVLQTLYVYSETVAKRVRNRYPLCEVIVERHRD
jgi:hypothetical protein